MIKITKQEYNKRKNKYAYLYYHKVKDHWDSLSDDTQKELCLNFTRDYMKKLDEEQNE